MAEANAAIRLLTSNGMHAVLDVLLPAFRGITGSHVTVRYGTGQEILERIAAGETADVVICSRAALQDLARARKVEAASVRDLATSSVGVAVRTGANRIRRGRHEGRKSSSEMRREQRNGLAPLPVAKAQQLGLQLQQPRPSVRALERATGRALEVGQLRLERRRRQMRIQLLRDLGGERQLRTRAQQACEEPVHVHCRVPVVAAVERRVQHALRPRVCGTREQMQHMTRVFARYVGERGTRKGERQWAGQSHANAIFRSEC